MASVVSQSPYRDVVTTFRDVETFRFRRRWRIVTFMIFSVITSMDHALTKRRYCQFFHELDV